MQRAHQPTPPSTAAHAGPPAETETGEDPAAEARQVAKAVRTRLQFLEAGGVTGLPKPKGRPARAARAPAAPSPAEAPPARVEVAEHVMPPAPPPSSEAHADGPAGALQAAAQRRPAPPPAAPPATRPAAKAPSIVEAVYPELQALNTPRGAEGLVAIRKVIGDCRRCKLCFARNNLVYEDGSPNAWLAFVGEGPGADEDRLGKPFVGAAGQLLDRMIEAMAGEARKRGQEAVATHLSRQAVYICNVVKCRPPGNRTPEADEIGSCTPFLRGQLEALRPNLRAIVALGRTPTQYLLRTTTPISSLRGRFADWEGIPVMPTYHPAYLLRTPSAKRQVWEDLQQVIDVLANPPLAVR